MYKSLSILINLLSFIILTTFVVHSNAYAFTLKTNAFQDKGSLPILYTCDGNDISPALSWINPPAKTASFALILSDPDAPGGTFYHWILYNIPVTITTLPEGLTQLPTGVAAGKNNWEKAKYNGPCPPKGTTHHYIFTLYALDKELSLPSGISAPSLLKAIHKHILGKAELNVRFSH